MLEKHKLLTIIIAIILIPVLLGTTPMNLVQRLSSPPQQSLDEQIKRTSSCLFNSMVFQNDLGIVDLYLASLEWKPADPLYINVHDLVHFHISLVTAILRC